MPEEFVNLINDCIEILGLHVILESKRNQSKPWNGSAANLLSASRVYLTTDDTISEDEPIGRVDPARLGWVSIEVPRAENNKLECIQLGAKSDWFDSAAGEIRHNKNAVRLFDRVWNVFSKRLEFPVRARNIVTRAEASYPAFGYSSGAASWWRQGGHLRQRGVENIEFLLPE